MSLEIKKRGRPSFAEVAARQAKQAPSTRPDAVVLADLKDRFGMLGKLTTASLNASIRSLVVTGAPGVGKTFTVEQVLENTPDAKYEIVKGGLSAVNLFKLGWRNRKAGSVVVLDDADGIFLDEDALNILKALCDSSPIR